MIAFSSDLFDLTGHFYFKDADIDVGEQSHRNIARRVSRTKTLDGGVYITDSGISVGDKDVKILIRQPDTDRISTLKNLFNNHSRFTVSSNDGVYTVIFESMKMTSGNLLINFYVEDTA